MAIRGDISFLDIFRKYGKRFVEELQGNIQHQQDIDGATMIPSKGAGKEPLHKRLIVTGKFLVNAFRFVANRDSLRVYANPAEHSKGVSYDDIVTYNNKPTSDQKYASLIFPKTQEDVEKMESYKELERDVLKNLEQYCEAMNKQLSMKMTVRF